jgi:hypothetical protein
VNRLALPASVNRVRRDLVTVDEAEVVGVVAGEPGRTTPGRAGPVLTERADDAFAVRPSSVAVAPCHDHRSHCHGAVGVAAHDDPRTCCTGEVGSHRRRLPSRLRRRGAVAGANEQSGFSVTAQHDAAPPGRPCGPGQSQTCHDHHESTLQPRPGIPGWRRGTGHTIWPQLSVSVWDGASLRRSASRQPPERGCAVSRAGDARHILPKRRWRLPSRDSADPGGGAGTAAVVALKEAIT